MSSPLDYVSELHHFRHFSLGSLNFTNHGAGERNSLPTYDVFTSTWGTYDYIECFCSRTSVFSLPPHLTPKCAPQPSGEDFEGAPGWGRGGRRERGLVFCIMGHSPDKHTHTVICDWSKHMNKIWLLSQVYFDPEWPKHEQRNRKRHDKTQTSSER